MDLSSRGWLYFDFVSRRTTGRNNLDITSRGPIHDKAMAKAIARGARKHGFDSLTTQSVQPGGGTNTVVFEPSRARILGPI